jgi:hypothetical protein
MQCRAHIIDNRERSSVVIAGSAQFEERMVPDVPGKTSDPVTLLGKGFGRVEPANDDGTTPLKDSGGLNKTLEF